MRKGILFLISLFIISACSKDDTTTPEPEPVQIPKYTVTIKAGDGGTVSSAGGTYNKESEVSVTATPNAEYLFESWSDGSTDNPRTIKVGADLTITANFIKKQYDLTVNIVGEGAVAEEVVIQGGRYNSGSQIKLTATAAEGWEFSSWAGAIESTDNPVTVNINEGKEVTATFTRKKYDLTITIEGEGTVTEEVVVQPAQYDYETQVKLTAVPEPGWEFSAWSGDLESTENPLILEISQEIEISAVFIEKDTDGDGVPDSLDQDNSTREGAPVDGNGVMLNPIYLDDNGITIKARSWAEIGDVGQLDNSSYRIVDLDELKDLIFNNKDYSKVCTSLIQDMTGLFGNKSGLSYSIVSWDVSNVTNMQGMFAGTPFNQNISVWDVSKVENMRGMFSGIIPSFYHPFNQPINEWDVSSVTDMSSMFNTSDFNQPIGNWDVSNVTTISFMFNWNRKFNQELNTWDVSKVINMDNAFRSSVFNRSLANWDVSQVKNMSGMFMRNRVFNQDLSSWNVSNVNNMDSMFFDTPKYNQDLSNWNVLQVTRCSDFFIGVTNWTLPKPNFINCNPN